MRKNQGWILIYGLTAAGFLLLSIWCSAAVTALSESAPVVRKHCILIDAGHGGEDGGAVSCTGRSESFYNLEIALRLNDLCHLLGYDTKMIRTTDVSIYTDGSTIAQKKASDLKQRVHIANSTENALLLSIHQNHFSDSRYRGAQVFFRKNAASQALAQQLQANLVKTLNPGSNRKSKESTGVYLMEHILCPGVLIECGFLSNVQEEAKLREPDYQKQLCIVISTTVSQFLSNT